MLTLISTQIGFPLIANQSPERMTPTVRIGDWTLSLRLTRYLSLMVTYLCQRFPRTRGVRQNSVALAGKCFRHAPKLNFRGTAVRIPR